jgi:hypothetical protein
LAVSALLVTAHSVAAQVPFDNFNIYGVVNGPHDDPLRRADELLRPHHADRELSLEQWPWRRPGSIALKGDRGYYRTFPVVGAGGSPLTNWIANVNDTLPADTYTILDSDLFTWSQNLQSGGRGFARVYGTLVAAPPPPPGHAPPPPHLAAFGFPSLNGYFVGQSFKGTGLSGNGIDCSGKTSADAFCRAEGYSSALNFTTTGLTYPAQTRALGDGAICSINPSRCLLSSLLRAPRCDVPAVRVLASPTNGHCAGPRSTVTVTSGQSSLHSNGFHAQVRVRSSV